MLLLFSPWLLYFFIISFIEYRVFFSFAKRSQIQVSSLFPVLIFAFLAVVRTFSWTVAALTLVLSGFFINTPPPWIIIILAILIPILIHLLLLVILYKKKTGKRPLGPISLSLLVGVVSFIVFVFLYIFGPNISSLIRLSIQEKLKLF